MEGQIEAILLNNAFLESAYVLQKWLHYEVTSIYIFPICALFPADIVIGSSADDVATQLRNLTSYDLTVTRHTGLFNATYNITQHPETEMGKDAEHLL